MAWKLFIKSTVANLKKRGDEIILYTKPEISNLIGNRIYFSAISRKGRTIMIEMDLRTAKRFAEEINKHLETRKRLDERNAACALVLMIKRVLGGGNAENP